MRLMFYENVLSEKVILEKMYLLEQFLKCLLWGSNFTYVFYERAIQFENLFFKQAKKKVLKK